MVSSTTHHRRLDSDLVEFGVDRLLQSVAPDAAQAAGSVSDLLNVRIALDDDCVFQEEFIAADVERPLRC